MELPRKILIGQGVISQVGPLIRTLNQSASEVAVVTGRIVKSKAGNDLGSSLENVSLKSSLHLVSHPSMDIVNELQDKIGDKLPDFVIGFGGGRSVDIAKMTAFRISRPFLSVPTSASHDGISSPFVSIRGTNKPHSIKATTPIGVIAFMECGLLVPLMETNGLDIPSCDAEVGTLRKGLLILKAIIFAISTERPPPNPITKSGNLPPILCCSLSTTSIDALLTICNELFMDTFSREEPRSSPALDFTVLPVTTTTSDAL